MFDNEIDWVTCMECSPVRREAHPGERKIYVCDIQGRANAQAAFVSRRKQMFENKKCL